MMDNKDFTNKIINNGRGSIVLIYEDGSAYHLEGMFKGEFTDEYYTDEDCYVDREYMRNTKIRVDNEEHWNFVQKLLSNMNISWEIGKEIREYSSDAFLLVDKDLDLVWDYLIDYDTCDDKEGILPMKRDLPKEWPQVGDDVVCVHMSSQTLTGELLALTKEYAIIQQKGFEQHLHLQSWSLSKPPTPEEELGKKILKFLENGKTYDQLSKAIVEGKISGLYYRKDG